MANMKKCPNCGSERISVNGVVQRKKGLMYYLGGRALQDAGTRSGYKAAKKFKKDKTNAECLACGHKWIEE